MLHNRELFADVSDVSRETLEDYDRWHALLKRWNARINLVSRGDLDQFWSRHALDSWQITPILGSVFAKKAPFMVNKSPKIIDFGSGGGFPAIAAAIHCKHSQKGEVTMIESVGKKAAFLKTVIRELRLPAKVLAERIENLPPQNADIITARAFAPLPRLLTYAAPHQTPTTEYILLKGANVDEELEIASATWTFTSKTAKSLTDEAATILRLTNVTPK